MPKHLSTGPPLPYGIWGCAMAPSPDGDGVILIGGYDGSEYLDSILELKSDGQGWVGSWTTLTTKLKFPRYRHVVIPVLMDKNICALNGIISTNIGKYCNTIICLKILIKNVSCHYIFI